MKELLFLTLGLMIPIINYGQSELAIITDPGGIIAVHAEKNSDSEIIVSIKANHLFLCEPSEESWWKIDNFYTKIGFVQKSKIQLIKDLSEKHLRNLILNSICKLQDYRLRYDSLRLILPNDERLKLLIEFEDFEETVYTPLLPFLSKLFCINKDIDLLDKFLNVMLINQMSANEMPAWGLGDCYLCHADIVLKQIKKYNGKDKEYLWSMLTFGFENVTWQKENEIDDYQELKNKLNE